MKSSQFVLFLRTKSYILFMLSVESVVYPLNIKMCKYGRLLQCTDKLQQICNFMEVYNCM